MKLLSLYITVLLASYTVVTTEAIAQSYEEAEKMWEDTRFDSNFGAYMGEFAQFNNYHKLDTRNGCFNLGEGPTEIFFVIEYEQASASYKIAKAIQKAETERVKCFKYSYLGIPVKQPPFLPFLFKMEFN